MESNLDELLMGVENGRLYICILFEVGLRERCFALDAVILAVSTHDKRRNICTLKCQAEFAICRVLGRLHIVLNTRYASKIV